MNSGRFARRALIAVATAALGLVWGCGESSQKKSASAAEKPTKIVFIGFDASPPLVEALRDGTLQGIVVQNPLRMGDAAVKTLVDALEKKPVIGSVSTGETLVTHDNIDDAEIRQLLDPPKARGTDAAGSTAKTKKWRVMVIPKGTTHEFWKTIHAGALKAAEELGNVEIVWQGPLKEDDRTEQIKLVRQAVAVGVDGIVLAPLDEEALVEPAEQAIAKGIPVVIIDSSLKSDKPIAYVATDNYHGGVLAARRLGELLRGKGRVLLMRYMVGSASTDLREKGFLDTINKEYPEITFVSKDQYAGATSDQAQRTAQSLVTRYRGRIDGIFCSNESSTFGMLRALEGAGVLSPGKR